MSIKIAYDISNLGVYFGRYDAKHGINRVVDELLNELSHRDELEVTAVALEGDDPFVDSIKASLYLDTRKPSINCGFNYTFYSGPVLTKAYKTVLRASQTPDGVVSRSLRAALLRRLLAALYKIANRHRVESAKRVFDSRKFDVFHRPRIGLPDKAITGSLPRVATVYDLIPALRPDFVTQDTAALFRKQLAKINPDTDWVTCISEFARTEFCEFTGMSRDRAFVAPLAADEAFRPVDDLDLIASVRQRYSIPAGDYFLTLAAPQPRKNLAHLIRCFFRLLDEQPALDVNLVLAGSKDQGWMYNEIFDAAESSSKHRQRVLFTGFVADEDLPALYSGALAFVFPSLYEGFGLPPLEAMQCGVPVITSNATALPEVVGDAGITVDPHDADELCQALLDVANDSELRRSLAEAGLRRSRQFTWARCADETMKAYRAAVSESPRGGRGTS